MPYGGATNLLILLRFFCIKRVSLCASLQQMSGGGPARSSGVKSRELLAPKPLLLPSTQHRDTAGAPDEPTATAPASPSTEKTMSHQLGARGNDRDQHQLPECIRCNFIAHMLSDVHAEHDWQRRSRRD